MNDGISNKFRDDQHVKTVSHIGQEKGSGRKLNNLTVFPFNSKKSIRRKLVSGVSVLAYTH